MCEAKAIAINFEPCQILPSSFVPTALQHSLPVVELPE